MFFVIWKNHLRQFHKTYWLQNLLRDKIIYLIHHKRYPNYNYKSSQNCCDSSSGKISIKSVPVLLNAVWNFVALTVMFLENNSWILNILWTLRHFSTKNYPRNYARKKMLMHLKFTINPRCQTNIWFVCQSALHNFKSSGIR